MPNAPHEDGGTSASGEPSDAALPPGVAFMEGTIKCCAKGLGQSCCTAREKDVGECAEFQGCTPAGHTVRAKIVCSICCEGLVPMSPARYVDGKCESPQALDSNVCAPCGDGVCNASAGENPCSCPADCI
jgi:hypothetical protein